MYKTGTLLKIKHSPEDYVGEVLGRVGGSMNYEIKWTALTETAREGRGVDTWINEWPELSIDKELVVKCKPILLPDDLFTL